MPVTLMAYMGAMPRGKFSEQLVAVIYRGN